MSETEANPPSAYPANENHRADGMNEKNRREMPRLAFLVQTLALPSRGSTVLDRVRGEGSGAGCRRPSGMGVAGRCAPAVLALMVAACHSAAPVPAPPVQVDGERIAFPAGSRQAEVLVSAPVAAAQATTIGVPGRLAWDDTRTARVFAAMGGQVAKIEAQPGDVVQAGQTLARIASPSFGEAQSERVRAEADLRQAGMQRRRARELHAAGVVATKDLEDSEAAYAHAQAEYARTQARAKLYGGGNGVDQDFPLRAPIAGVVVERRITPGQEVSPEQAQGDGPALFTISDPSRLWLLLDLPESAAGSVQAGRDVSFAVQGGDGSRIQAMIEHVDDFVDADTRSVHLRASIDNAARTLKAGMYVHAEIASPARPGFDVPNAAVLLVDGRRVVFVDEGSGRYRRQDVRAAEVGGSRMHVDSGLADGERVVVGGALYLQQLIAAQAPR